MLPPILNDSPRGTYPVCISFAEARWWRTLQDGALLLTSPVLQEVASPLTGQALKCSLQQANSGAVNQMAWVCCLLN